MDQNKKNQTFTSFLIGVTLLLVIFLTLRIPNDPDMWWHLRSGNEMVSQFKILTTDTFSYTRAGSAWTNVFWLADVGLYLLFRLGGFYSLSLFVAILAAGIMAILMKHSPGPIYLRVGLILLAGFAISAFMNPRPQLLTFLLLALLDYGLTRYKQNHDIPVWLLIPFFVLWANLHGGFFLGFLLLAAVLLGEVINHLTHPEEALSWRNIRQLLSWGALAWLSTVINPSGLSLWKLPFYTLQVSMGTIMEYASPNFHRLDLQVMLWFVFLLVFGAGFSKKMIGWPDLFKFCGFAYMAFVAQRGIPIFVIVAVPVVSRHISQAWDENLKPALFPPRSNEYQRQATSFHPLTSRIINTFTLLTLSILVLAHTYSLTTPESVYSEVPQKAVEWVKVNQPAGNMFSSYNWGGYLTWALPQYPVFIDGRADLYGDDLMKSWLDVVNGSDNGIKTLDQWHVKIILLEPASPILQKLAALGWQQAYKDDKSVIWTR